MTDFRKKADIFNSFCAKQYWLVNSDSSLPSKVIKKTGRSSLFSKIFYGNILQIINKLDSNKSHGYDEISIRMFKKCSSSVCRPLQIIYKSCLDRSFHRNRTKLILSQLKIIVLSPCYLYVVKFFNVFSIILCLISWTKITSYLQLSSSQVTLVLINCYK